MAIPEPIEARTAADFLAVMSQAVFQAGVAWKMIADRWENYRRSFEEFDPTRVAALDSSDLERILHEGGVMRTYRKLAATVENARSLLELERTYGSFAAYLDSFPNYAATARDLKKRFKFMGELNAYYFLFRVRRPVPPFEEWETTVPGDHPRMREMVALARGKGLSSERPDA